MRPFLNIESIATFLFEDLAVASGLFGNMDDYQYQSVMGRTSRFLACFSFLKP